MKGCVSSLLLIGSLLGFAEPRYTTESFEISSYGIPSESGYNCTFSRGFCGWRQGTADDFDWSVGSGNTPSSGTGPAGDHTSFYGRYVYIETSAPRTPSDKADLEGPYFIIYQWETKCFSFWFNMNGETTGILEVYTVSAAYRNTVFTNRLWTLNGNRGPMWHHSAINITGSGQIKILIRGVRGTGYSGDIAVDDTTLSDGECTEDSITPEYYSSVTSDSLFGRQTTINPYRQQTSDYNYGTRIRLVNGPNYHSGRVEVFHNGQWGTVCDDQFDHQDLMVVCKMLNLYKGSRYGVIYARGYYGTGVGPIMLDNLQCTGYEANIGSCSSNGWYQTDCSHTEDVGVDCYAFNNYEQTTYSYPWWIQSSPATTEGSVRLVGGNGDFGRVEVFSNGQWGTICDDSFDHDDVKVICRMLGRYYGDNYGVAYSNAQFGQGSGPIIVDDLRCNGYEANIRQCNSTRWYTSDCTHSEDASVDCSGIYYWHEMTTMGFYNTTYPWWLRTTNYPWWLTSSTYHWWTHYSTHSTNFENAINVDCNEYTWNVVVDMNRLRQVFPNAKGSDIYLGESKCRGLEKNGHLTFQQGLDECLTSGRLQHGRSIYNNELIYAEHDPVYTFIIRHYNWTVNIECDVDSYGSGYGYVNSETSSPSPSLSSPQYPVNISYYLDPNYMKEVSANPLHVPVGSKVYVKVFTETYDWNAKMRVVSCYTKPTYNAPDHTKYYLLKNGCEVDTNTHIISQSSHETRFVFDNFEYTSNHEGIYVFCDTIFCDTHDYSAKCRQSCNPVIRRKITVEKVPTEDQSANITTDDIKQDP